MQDSKCREGTGAVELQHVHPLQQAHISPGIKQQHDNSLGFRFSKFGQDQDEAGEPSRPGSIYHSASSRTLVHPPGPGLASSTKQEESETIAVRVLFIFASYRSLEEVTHS
jgi:hypothetical protein